MSSKIHFIQKIRNFGLFAHIDAGKTTTTERILYYTGKSYKIGEVHEGTAVMDWMDQEQERGITITAAATTCEWNHHTLHLIDTPGHVDFTVEVERTLRVLDGAIIIFDATQGVEPQSESVWRIADEYKVPRIGFINKMDRLGAGFIKSIDSIKARFNSTPLALQIPLEIDENQMGESIAEEKLCIQESLKINDKKKFVGVIDLVKEKMILWPFHDLGEKFLERDIPDHLKDKCQISREQLIEKIADFDDVLLEKFVNGEKVSSQNLLTVLKKATLDLKIVPVFCGSAFKNKGIQPLLDAVISFLPSPKERLRFFEETSQNQKIKELVRKADVNLKLLALVFKVVFDPYMGKLSYVRIYSGCLSLSSPKIFNSNSRKKEKIQKILKMHANHREEVNELKAGEIGAVVGLKFSRTGETLCDLSENLILGKMQFSEPVISVAIEAESTSERERMLQVLEVLHQEDPSCKVTVNPETAQTLLNGMGELHLEVLLERLLREHKLKIKSGTPQVSYRESIKRKSFGESVFEKEIDGISYYARCKLSIEPFKNRTEETEETKENKTIEGKKPIFSSSPLPNEKKSSYLSHPSSQELSKGLKEKRKNPNRVHISFSKVRYLPLTAAFLKMKASLKENNKASVQNFLIQKDQLNFSLKQEQLIEIRKSLQEALQVGPLMGCSLIQMKVEVLELEFISQDISEVALKSTAFNALRAALSENECHLFEPIFKVEILTPEPYTGKIVSDFNLKRGHVVEILPLIQSNIQMNKMRANVPLASLMGYATSLRSLTQGRATFNMEFKEYAPMPLKEENALLRKMGLLEVSK